MSSLLVPTERLGDIRDVLLAWNIHYSVLGSYGPVVNGTRIEVGEGQAEKTIKALNRSGIAAFRMRDEGEGEGWPVGLA